MVQQQQNDRLKNNSKLPTGTINLPPFQPTGMEWNLCTQSDYYESQAKIDIFLWFNI